MDRENKVKILACISRLKFLTEDWSKVTTLEMSEQAERLIIAKATELVKLAEPKKSEMACNCCAECAEEIDAMEEMNRAVDMFIKAANKLANK